MKDHTHLFPPAEALFEVFVPDDDCRRQHLLLIDLTPDRRIALHVTPEQLAQLRIELNESGA